MAGFLEQSWAGQNEPPPDFVVSVLLKEFLTKVNLKCRQGLRGVETVLILNANNFVAYCF
jgi:hypothetical protein